MEVSLGTIVNALEVYEEAKSYSYSQAYNKKERGV